MKILKNSIKSNFVTINFDGLHVGCGFLFKSNNITYCVTALLRYCVTALLRYCWTCYIWE
ncbi:hypothetical protein E4T25_18110 [Photobacterium damselae subsp. piscicida]|nr:hypothetical protein E4T25_18110 [Photobacterium damselae subsp. piscicida]